MIEIVLAHSDLARVRFAHSPIEELVASLRVLQDPGRQLMYGRWLAATRSRLGGLRLELLTALAPTGRYLPSATSCSWSTSPITAPTASTWPAPASFWRRVLSPGRV